MAPRSEFDGYTPDDEPAFSTVFGLSIVSVVLAIAIAVTFAVLMASRARAAAPLSCLPGSVRAALARVDAACGGIQVISTYRRGAAIAGTGGSPSMHRWCRAADFTTPHPDCVLATLADWPHALSVDYASVKHFHIDDGTHIRFTHGQHLPRRHVRHHGAARDAVRDTSHQLAGG